MSMEIGEGRGVAGCTSCGGGSRVIAHRTPAEYMAAARQREASFGTHDPRTQKAMKEAALAYGVAAAAARGDTRLAAIGISGLRSLSDGPVLTREEISTKYAEIANRQVTANLGNLRAVAAVAGVVLAAVRAAGAAISNPRDRAAFDSVLAVIHFAVSRAGGGTATLPPLSADAAEGMRGFCGVWTGISGAIDSAISAAADGYAIRDIAAASAIRTLGSIVINVANGLCADPQINPASGGATTTQVSAAVESCFRTTSCPSGQHRRVRADGSGCECYTPTGTESSWTPQTRATQNYRQAVAARKLVEMAILNPTVAPPFGSRGISPATLARNNCVSACTLAYASREVLAVTGSVPAIPGTPSPGGVVGYFNPATAPQDCNCAGETVLLPGRPVYEGDAGPSNGGGGATIAVAAGGAAALLFFMLRG